MAQNEDASEQGFARLFTSHWHHFVRSARAPLGSADEAEDAVSTAFTRAFARRASFDARYASLPTWMATIVRNEVIDRLRRRARLPMVDLAAAERLASGEDGAATVELHDALAQALARLSARDRQVLALRFGQGLTNREIARLLDADERTVSVWILRALRRLKPLVNAEECAE
ncbi:MAG: RNA polymerase sigma factor [Thermomicrobiales bacterium]